VGQDVGILMTSYTVDFVTHICVLYGITSSGDAEKGGIV
jgi:hypothetical protein